MVVCGCRGSHCQLSPGESGRRNSVAFWGRGRQADRYRSDGLWSFRRVCREL